jgi:hypothetical protein
LRRESYEQAGHYVVDHCDLLIAVWDREPSRGRGGTAEIVQYALEQRRPVIRVWEGAFEMLNREDCHGLDASALGCIDQFNREHVPAEARQNRGEKLDRSLFVAPAAAADVPPAARNLVNRFLTPYYAQASIIAEQNQKKFYRAGKSIYTYSALAVGCAAAGVLLESAAWWVPCLAFGVELVLLVVILLTLHHAHGARAHQRWIENRFLAERIRCSIFLAICGVEPRPIEVLPYMGHSQTSNDWMVRVLDEIWDRIPPLAACNQQEPQQLNAYVREAWIEDQMTFHQGKQKREGKMRRRLSRAGQIVLPITLAAAIGHLLLPLWKTGSIEAGPFFEWMRRGLTFIALMFPAIAASLAGMEAHREYLRLEKRSANMVPQLQKLSHQMGSATDRMRFESLLQQLDEVMLRETQDWLMLMRFVEIKAG